MANDATDFIAPTITKPIDYKAITDPRERLVALSGFLRGLPPKRFDISAYMDGPACWYGRELGIVTTDCEIVACICGWAAALYAPQAKNDSRLDDIVAPLLGLSAVAADKLFRPAGWLYGEVGRNPTQAANVIDHYLAHGVIDWGKA